MRKLVQIQLRVTRKRREWIKAHSSKKRWSMNSYLNYLVEEDKAKYEMENK